MPPALSHTYVLVVHTRKHYRTSPVMAILAAPTCTRLGILGLRDHELLSRQVQLAQLRARLRRKSIRHGTLLQRKYGQPRRQS